MAGVRAETFKLLEVIYYVERERREYKVRKNLLWISFIALLILSVLTGFSVNTLKVSAVEYPAIMVVPENVIDENLKLGENFTVSIYTDYTGNDVWSWELSLTYNPLVLNIFEGSINKTDTWTGDGSSIFFYVTRHPVVPGSEKVYVNEALKTRDVDYWINYVNGEIRFGTPPGVVEVKATYSYGGVVNGDLITRQKDSSFQFLPGDINNTKGELETTGAVFIFIFPPAFLTSGPGIFVNVTFTVAGYGTSDITIGDDTRLIGVKDGGYGEKYDIINANRDFDHIQHGFFSNKIVSDIRGPESPPGSGLYPFDGVVDMWDFGFIGLAYGKTSADPDWSDYKIADTRGPENPPGSGLNPPDGQIDMWDFGYCGLQYGKSFY